MRAAEFWVEVVCHDCATSGPGMFISKRLPISFLTEEARKAGWRLRTGGSFECPRCAKRGMDAVRKGLDRLTGGTP